MWEISSEAVRVDPRSSRLAGRRGSMGCSASKPRMAAEAGVAEVARLANEARALEKPLIKTAEQITAEAELAELRRLTPEQEAAVLDFNGMSRLWVHVQSTDRLCWNRVCVPRSTGPIFADRQAHSKRSDCKSVPILSFFYSFPNALIWREEAARLAVAAGRRAVAAASDGLDASTTTQAGGTPSWRRGQRTAEISVTSRASGRCWYQRRCSSIVVSQQRQPVRQQRQPACPDTGPKATSQ